MVGSIETSTLKTPITTKYSTHDRASTDSHMKTLVHIPSKLGTIARTFGSCMLSAGADSRACTAWSTSFSSISQESNSIDRRNLLF